MTTAEQDYREAKRVYDAAMSGPNRRYEQAEHMIVAKYERLRLQDPYNEERAFRLRGDQARELKPHKDRLERETAPIKAAFEAASRRAREALITQRNNTTGRASPSELARRQQKVKE